MKLAHYCLDEPIEFEENKVQILVVENQILFRSLILELQEQTRGVPGRFILSKGLDVLEINRNIELLTDLFNIDFTSKKITTKVNQEIVQQTLQYPEKCFEITKLVNELAQMVVTEVEFETSYNELVEIDGIIKLLNFSLDYEDMSFSERILEYMKICNRFFGKKVFVFVNLKNTLFNNELNLLYKNALYNKFNLLLIEAAESQKFENEKIKIVDKDLCEI